LDQQTKSGKTWGKGWCNNNDEWFVLKYRIIT
jgi:hypothetical protein